MKCLPLVSSERRHAHAFAAVFNILAIATAHAQTAPATDADVITLDRITVMPTPLPGIGIDSATLPYTVQTLRYDDARGTGGANLSGVINNRLTGVNVNDVQGSPFQTDVTFHGFRASPTLGADEGISVYMDGVRINEPFGDIVAWDALPESAIESVTLMPGANPLFGLNTLGGALILTTKSGLTAPGFDADLSLGSNARKRADLAYGASNALGWHVFAAGTYFDENGWRDDSPGRLHNLFVKFGRHTDHDDWDIDVLHASSKLIGNGLLPGSRYDEDAETFEPGLFQHDRRAIYTAPDLTDSLTQQFGAHYTHHFSADTQFSALAYARHSRRNTVNGDVNDDYEDFVDDCGAGFDAAGNPLDDDCEMTRDQAGAVPTGVLNTTRTRQHGQGVGLAFDSRLGAHQVAFGVTYDHSTVRYDQFEQAGNIDDDREVHADASAPVEFFSGVGGSSRMYGVYATDTWALAAGTHLTGALRWNDLQLDDRLSSADNGIGPQEHHGYRKLNPALGITQDAGGGWTLFASATQSNRAPTVIELGCADPAQPCRLPTGLQADPSLQQVVSRSIQMGGRWKGLAGLQFDGELYRTQNRNDILFLSTPSSQQGYFANFPHTRHEGADLNLSQHTGPWDWHVSYSYLLATYEAHGVLQAGERSVNVRPGTRIAGLPRNTLKAGMDWKATARLQLGMEVLSMSSSVSNGNEDGSFSDDAPDLRHDWDTGGYTLVNLRASWWLGGNTQLYARIDNLFDRRYASYGAVSDDVLPDGQLIRPQQEPGEAASTLFVAPGAPRLFTIGVRVQL